jgi:hypothetical protein
MAEKRRKMKKILESWRLYENQALKDGIEREFRIILINWVSKYSPGSSEGKKLEAWFNTNKKSQFNKYSYDQLYGAMVQYMDQIAVVPLMVGEELFPRRVAYSKNSQQLAAYGPPPLNPPYDKQKTGMFIVNAQKWSQSDEGRKKDIINHEAGHWLDWFKGFIGSNTDTKFASQSGTDLSLLKTIFLDSPVDGHGLNQEQLQYFGSKKEQRAYLKQYVGSSLSKGDIFNICTAQREIVASGGFKSLTPEKYKDISSRVNFRPELILYFNCGRASQDQIIDAVKQLVKVDQGQRTMVAEREASVDPKMKKYLEDHPYMEPDGMQEGETQDIPETQRKILLRIKKQLQKSAEKHARQARQATDIAKASQKSSDLHRDQVDQLDAMTEDNLEEKRGATPAYCRSTACKDMGFTQKASCKSQGIKDCYRGKKKNEQVELQERCQKGYKTHPTRKTKIMFGKRYRNCVKAEEGRMLEADPKKGTGKKPKGSGRRLYTDENPKDTVSVEFSSVAAIKRTLAKASFKAKSHKRQSQIINLIHQRVRAAYKNAKDPKVKARLKRAYEYAEERKEASKKKTARLRKAKK